MITLLCLFMLLLRNGYYLLHNSKVQGVIAVILRDVMKSNHARDDNNVGPSRNKRQLVT